VKLIWNCPNCGSRNPGPQKICSNCGTPQPDNVKFEQLPQAELVTDEAEIGQAKAGADVHCYYCGTRNPVTAKACSQCGADLTQAAARESGQILGAHQSGPAQPLLCPSCGTPNDPNASKCVQCGAALTQPQEAEPKPAAQPAPAPTQKSSMPLFAIIGGAVLLLVIGACITFLVLSTRTTGTSGQVESVSWTRRILIEQLTPVSGEDWRDEIPAGAVVGSCSERQRGAESHDTGQTQEVCGTPYTVDTGTGFGEVKQDCETEQIYEDVPVYADYCSYTATVWQAVDGPTLTGDDLNPRWPEANLAGLDQREAGREEQYSIVFKTEEKTYTYTTSDANEFQQFQIGSQWTLNVNTFDVVNSVEPR
ncbi:MAG: zinc ribbon domain-containing protein, partial [Chloroflexi bacterium]|nr:zinc ribbon domain-containing protein [Chloroflexota bacterium]